MPSYAQKTQMCQSQILNQPTKQLGFTTADTVNKDKSDALVPRFQPFSIAVVFGNKNNVEVSADVKRSPLPRSHYVRASVCGA